MRRWITMVTVLLLVLAACGGGTGDEGTDDGEEQTETTQADDTTLPADDDGAEETTPPTEDGGDNDGDEGSDSEGEGPSTATVTLGDETYNFSSEAGVVAQCLTDLFGIFSIQLAMVDDSGELADGNVSITVLHEDTDPEVVDEVNSVRLDIGELWIADAADEVLTQTEQFEPGISQVDSVEIDGRTVRGTATFVRQDSLFFGDEAETMTGTFEATCGEERMS